MYFWQVCATFLGEMSLPESQIAEKGVIKPLLLTSSGATDI